MNYRHLTCFLISAALILGGCSSIHVVKIEESIVFPETDDVTILAEKPDSAHVVIALLEVEGGSKKSILSALNEMERSARTLGADALIARMIRLNKIKTNQPFKLRGTAIKYASSIKKLTRDNVRLVYPVKPIIAGGSLRPVPFLLGGYGASVWVGIKRFRLRAEFLKFNTPNIFWQDGFKDGRLTMTNVYLDYFLKEPDRGFYLFSGPGSMKGSVRHEKETVRGYHKNSTINFGIGYSCPVTGYFTVSSTITAHAITGGSREFMVGAHPVMLNPVFPSAAVNLELHW